MNMRILSVVSMFVASVIVGYNILSPTVVAQAAEPVIPSIVEMPSFIRPIAKENKSVDKIDVSVDLSTMEVSVKGTTDAIVNVKTVGEPTPVVKYKTKVIEKHGYPYSKRIGQHISEEPATPLSVVKSNE